jgi:putative glutamine amidotransferase
VRPRIGITTSRLARIDRYTAYVEAAGGEPVVLRPGDEVSLDQIDGLLLSGGLDVDPRHYGEPPDPTVEIDEERDALELAVARQALDAGMPVLGICRGMQLLNVVEGGSLVQHLDGHRTVNEFSAPSALHPVRVAPDSELARVLGAGEEVPVNSRHHQAVRPENLAPGLRATAWSPDGLIEAFEGQGPGWQLAVQWHPERVDEVDPACRRLAEALVEQAARSRART